MLEHIVFDSQPLLRSFSNYQPWQPGVTCVGAHFQSHAAGNDCHGLEKMKRMQECTNQNPNNRYCNESRAPFRVSGSARTPAAFCVCRDFYAFINGFIGTYVVGIATSSVTNPDRGNDVKGLGRIRNIAINRWC